MRRSGNRTVGLIALAAVPLLLVAGAGQAAGQNAMAAAQQAMNTMMAAAGMAAAPNPNCTIIVPDNPLSAQGLATPYQLVATDPAAGACDEANPAQSAFVQATVLDPATGKLYVYNPVVVNKGDAPAIAPTPPQLPQRAVVATWFGYQGDTLTLMGASANSLQQGACINGAPNSPFGQFAYCNAPAFFAMANNAIATGQLQVPPLGTASDGKPCMSSRDFALIDQDQSDNLSTKYLVTPQGKVAQDTAANRNALGMGNTKIAVNASDNRLLSDLVNPAISCQSWQIPDLANNMMPAYSLAANELQAAQYQLAPAALVPPNDPMAQVDGKTDLNKMNLYRAGANMPPLMQVTTEAADYCTNFRNGVTSRLPQIMPQLMQVASPDPAAATNLYGFMANRANAAYGLMNCPALIGQPAPFALMMGANVMMPVAPVNAQAAAVNAQAAGAQVAAANAQAANAQVVNGQMVNAQAQAANAQAANGQTAAQQAAAAQQQAAAAKQAAAAAQQQAKADAAAAKQAQLQARQAQLTAAQAAAQAANAQQLAQQTAQQ